MTGATNEERLTCLEEGQEHLATKADIVRPESRLDRVLTKEDLAQFEARILKWMAGAFLGSAMIASALTALID